MRSRLTAASYQTKRNDRHVSWCYDMATKLATNHHDTRMVVNKGLTASLNEHSGLNF